MWCLPINHEIYCSESLDFTIRYFLWCLPINHEIYCSESLDFTIRYFLWCLPINHEIYCSESLDFTIRYFLWCLPINHEIYCSESLDFTIRYFLWCLPINHEIYCSESLDFTIRYFLWCLPINHEIYCSESLDFTIRYFLWCLPINHEIYCSESLDFTIRYFLWCLPINHEIYCSESLDFTIRYFLWCLPINHEIYCSESLDFTIRYFLWCLPINHEIYCSESLDFTIRYFLWCLPINHEIYCSESLDFTIRYFLWCLPINHEIYQKHSGSFYNVTLSDLIKSIQNFSICSGVTDISYISMTSSLIEHSIPKIFNLQASSSPLSQSKAYRSSLCLIFVDESCNTECSACLKTKKKANIYSKRKDDNLNVPARLNAPIKFTALEKLKLTLQNYRIENKVLKSEIEQMRIEIATNSMSVGEDFSKDFVSIVSNFDQSKMPPFMKSFWDEQQKYLSSSNTSGVRYHPQIIRYCLSLAVKSPAFYDDIRYNENNQTGFLILPSRRRLRDYKNYIQPQQGFNKGVVNE